MASKKLFGVFFVVVATVAGCDAVAGFFGGDKKIVRREPKAERTLGPTATPGPIAAPRRTPEPERTLGPTSTPPSPTATPRRTPEPDPSVVIDAPTPAQSSSPGATPAPWLTARLVDQGNGLQKMEIQSGGFGMDERQNIFAIGGLDGEMYFLVYRWYLFQFGNDPEWTPEVYRKSGARTFRLTRLTDEAARFEVVEKLPAILSWSLSAGWASSHIRDGYHNPWERQKIINSLATTLPATPSSDVISLPAAYNDTPSARLAEQAGGRWGGDQISLAGLPWYPDDWYPVASGNGLRDSYHRKRASSKIDVDHAVGYRSAFAFRYDRIESEWYYCSAPDRFDRVDCDRRHTALDVGPLWRLNKGEAEWKPLQTIPRKSSNQDGGVVTNTWNQVWWSDVHRRWFFWVGAAYGDVYLVTEEAAAKLP